MRGILPQFFLPVINYSGCWLRLSADQGEWLSHKKRNLQIALNVEISHTFDTLLEYLNNLNNIQQNTNIKEQPILRVQNLSKHYGNLRAVDNLSFEVEQGMVFGILGPNGSGKTTTLGMLTSVLKARSGDFSWFGKASDHHIRKRIGVLLEKPNFYDYLSAENNLKVVADIRNLDYDLIPEVLKTMGLYERRKSKFKTFSLGMKQRLAIAAALLGNPEVLILDEPTNGLDPAGIAEVRELIRELARQNKTIILASHLLDEVRKVCTDLMVMKGGKKIFQGKIDALSQSGSRVELAAEDMEQLINALRINPQMGQIAESGVPLIFVMAAGVKLSDLHRYLIDQKIVLTHLMQYRENFESQVLELLNES